MNFKDIKDIDYRKLFHKYSYFILEKLKKWLWAIIRAGLVIGISYVILYPLILKVCISFMSKADLHDITVKYIARHFTLENYSIIYKNMEYFNALSNSIQLSVLTTILQVASCTIVAYGFARFKFKFREFLFALVILTLVVPPQTFMVSIYLRFRFFDVFGIYHLLTGQKGINMLGTVTPIALMSATCMGLRNGLYIYIMRQFFRGMNREIEESALVDGAGVFKTFYKIMLPNAIPALVTITLFAFVWQWNDTFYTSLFIPEYNSLTNALLAMPGKVNAIAQELVGGSAGYLKTDPVYVSMLFNTGAFFVILPLILMYIFAQRYFIESIERAGVVG